MARNRTAITQKASANASMLDCFNSVSTAFHRPIPPPDCRRPPNQCHSIRKPRPAGRPCPDRLHHRASGATPAPTNGTGRGGPAGVVTVAISELPPMLRARLNRPVIRSLGIRVKASVLIGTKRKAGPILCTTRAPHRRAVIDLECELRHRPEASITVTAMIQGLIVRGFDGALHFPTARAGPANYLA
jgi:hypothetical protein